MIFMEVSFRSGRKLGFVNRHDCSPAAKEGNDAESGAFQIWIRERITVILSLIIQGIPAANGKITRAAAPNPVLQGSEGLQKVAFYA